jgi:Heterokaryon incompatibility protein (HET)
MDLQHSTDIDVIRATFRQRYDNESNGGYKRFRDAMDVHYKGIINAPTPTNYLQIAEYMKDEVIYKKMYMNVDEDIAGTEFVNELVKILGYHLTKQEVFTQPYQLLALQRILKENPQNEYTRRRDSMFSGLAKWNHTAADDRSIWYRDDHARECYIEAKTTQPLSLMDYDVLRDIDKDWRAPPNILDSLISQVINSWKMLIDKKQLGDKRVGTALDSLLEIPLIGIAQRTGTGDDVLYALSRDFKAPVADFRFKTSVFGAIQYKPLPTSNASTTSTFIDWAIADEVNNYLGDEDYWSEMQAAIRRRAGKDGVILVSLAGFKVFDSLSGLHYIALSRVWADKTAKVHDLKRDIIEAVLDDVHLVWVDVLSVDSRPDKRRHDVANMSNVYSMANRVHICFGTSDRWLLRRLRIIAKRHSYFHVLFTRWESRIWTWQEACLAKVLTYCCEGETYRMPSQSELHALGIELPAHYTTRRDLSLPQCRYLTANRQASKEEDYMIGVSAMLDNDVANAVLNGKLAQAVLLDCIQASSVRHLVCAGYQQVHCRLLLTTKLTASKLTAKDY